ncbi:MAG: methylenetetrahydrofolate reductase [NAD(P)H] [Deltaproteobacteria bacterium]|nr:methylenetetrahydrofolate reductase [NAD(P)H] [Deltaproteobacteria bacterium]
MQKRISDIFKYNTHVSFEIFPPKTQLGLKQIYQTIANLKSLNPDFFSVTYGAGGSTAEKSLEIASALTNLAGVTCVAHFTCVGMTRDQVKELLRSLEKQGVSNVLALRGDPPKGQENFVKPQNGFAYASELVSFIKENSEIGILVAGYPEGHPENPSKKDDFKHLIEKVESGADGIVTQCCFDNRFMVELQENLDKHNIKAPLVPGIFPISSSNQIIRIIELSGASIPKKLKSGLEKYKDSPEDLEKFGRDFSVEQVEDLINKGFNAFHFYTMNRYQQTRDILYQLRGYFPSLTF